MLSLETFGEQALVKDTPVNCTDMESDFCYKIVLTGGTNATLRFVQANVPSQLATCRNSCMAEGLLLLAGFLIP